MTALRILVAVFVLMVAGVVTLGVLGAGLAPEVSTVEVDLAPDLLGK